MKAHLVAGFFTFYQDLEHINRKREPKSAWSIWVGDIFQQRFCTFSADIPPLLKTHVTLNARLISPRLSFFFPVQQGFENIL